MEFARTETALTLAPTTNMPGTTHEVCEERKRGQTSLQESSQIPYRFTTKKAEKLDTYYRSQEIAELQASHTPAVLCASMY